MNASLRDKKIAETLDIQGIVPRPMSAPDYRAFVVAEAEKFGKIVEQANIRLRELTCRHRNVGENMPMAHVLSPSAVSCFSRSCSARSSGSGTS